MTNNKRSNDRWYRRLWMWWNSDLMERYNQINERHGWTK